MPTRLSSLLVRDGIVGVRRMEKAFQRQVIYGGTLDTILLEMNEVPEARLVQYLALGSGLPPATRTELDAHDPEAIALLSEDLATQFHALPVACEGENLRILVCSPLEMSGLEDLADLLDRPLQPLITTELRWHLAFARAYGTEPPARFSTLAASLEGERAPPPVGRARSVIVDGSEATAPLVAAAARDAATPATRDAAPAATAAPTGPIDDATEKVVVDLPLAAPPRAHRDTLVDPVPHPRTRTTSGVPPVGPAHAPAAADDDAAVPVAVQRTVTERYPGPKRAATAVPAGRDSPLAIVPAREQLATADDRDTVFLTLLRATRARTRYAALLTVQGGAVIGRVALADAGLDVAAVQTVLIPLDVASPFRTVVTTQQPHIGALTSGDRAIDAMLLRFGGVVPPSALILPIVLRERVVAVMLAHQVHGDLRLVDVTELLPLANTAADALGRLIVRHKSAGYRVPAEAPAVAIEPDAIATRPIVRADAAWRVPAGRADAVDLDATPARGSRRARPIDELLTEIEQAAPGGAEAAIAEAIERAADVVPALTARFPGALRVARAAAGEAPLRAADYGPLLDLTVRLGPPASELLITQLGAAERDHRFYAAVCAAELLARSAVFALVERVFDPDPDVRALAVAALAAYPDDARTPALARARRALHSNDADVAAAAMAAIVALRDVEAVPDLIGSIERGDDASDAVHQALVHLTGQDFGTSERRWRKWWDVARRKHRVEWLIEALVHKEDALREHAIGELRHVTGEYFEYHHDLPRHERERAAERWVTWWNETGRRRFVLDDARR